MFINPEEFIDFCYQIFLQRPAELEGKQAYLEQLNSQQNWQTILQSFLDSAEFREKQLKQIQSRENKQDYLRNLYRYLLKREPSQVELENANNSPLTYQELLRNFGESEEYKNLNQSESNLIQVSDSLYGIMVKSEEINAYLLYPAFDKVQLQEALNGQPFQLTDFLACMEFLNNRELLSRQKTYFLDLGANIGSTSVYALKSNYFSNAICIEASSLNYQFLNFNSQINKLADKLKTFNYGLADFSGEGELICNPDNCGDFRIQPVNLEINSTNLFNEDNYTREVTQFITLNELMKQGILKSEEIGFIWIDCQGSEGLIFKGGEQFFQKVSVPLYVEFWPYGINRLAAKETYFNFIANYSSQLWKLTSEKFEPISLDFLNSFYNENLNTGEYIDILVIPNYSLSND